MRRRLCIATSPSGGRDLIDRNGERIGKLEDVYFDVESDEPQFGTVKEGWIGRHLTFVPLVGVTIGPDSLQVAVSKEQVKSDEGPERQHPGTRRRSGSAHR